MGSHVPAKLALYSESLTQPWVGFVWMNPPFGGRNGIEPWLEKFFQHGNGIALTPDRTGAPWFQKWGAKAWSILFLPKVRFIRPDGTEGRSPSNGTALMAAGAEGHTALKRARHLGLWTVPIWEAGEADEVNDGCAARLRASHPIPRGKKDE